ncbi:hypothetical protein [Azospirillum brasilense]|uniref:hypothetical protein n=1 Tax=Azospirillum brasilense TaxID=192 RepID=UPI001EDC1EDB|nr:hypothetical protein [Azospirillum brasilense]UKJ74244.1 hypothetical protein H1Q64_06575 [Azospirillum brasilense]
MAIKTYHPKIEVRLIKLVARKSGVSARYQANPRDVDLTPYLGEAGAVRTVKGLSEPAGGFTVSFADQSRGGLDSVYSLVEPMDMIEIRGAREPHRHAGGKLPLLMRGYVSTVHRSETMGANGEPDRVVTIAGQDSAKLLLIHQINFELGWIMETPYLTKYQLQAQTGMVAGVVRVKDYVTDVVKAVANKKLEELAGYSCRLMLPFDVKATVPDGSLTPGSIAPLQGSIWNLLEAHTDRPWNELFVEDTEEGPVVVFRPAPFKDLAGTLILPGATAPDVVELDAAAVQSLAMARSDSRVGNWFWVPPGTSTLDSSGWISRGTLHDGSQLDFEHGNNKPDLYGVKRVQHKTTLMPDLDRPLPQAPPDQQAAGNTAYVTWHIRRAQQLRELNRDNVVFEEGSATVRGSEDLKPGRYLRLTRGDQTSESYISRVEHSFSPLRSWTTLLRLERGTGFLERSKATQNPYFTEGRRGPYSL